MIEPTQVQTPQLPEPVYQDASAKIVAAFKSLDDMTMAALDAAGQFVAKAVTAVAAKTADVAANVATSVGNASPMEALAASGSPRGESSQAKGESLGRSKEKSIGTDQYGQEVGNLSPTYVAVAPVQEKGASISV